jgi:hypothetical protein
MYGCGGKGLQFCGIRGRQEQEKSRTGSNNNFHRNPPIKMTQSEHDVAYAGNRPQLKSDRSFQSVRERHGLDQGARTPARSIGKDSAETKSQRPDLLHCVPCIVREISWNGSSTRSTTVGGSRPDTTNSPPTIWRSSSSHPSAFGYALTSPSPKSGVRQGWRPPEVGRFSHAPDTPDFVFLDGESTPSLLCMGLFSQFLFRPVVPYPAAAPNFGCDPCAPRTSLPGRAPVAAPPRRVTTPETMVAS